MVALSPRDKTIRKIRFEQIRSQIRAIPDDEGTAAWANKLEFLVTSLGYAVGLGNVWRFPHLVYSKGGGAFLIPYTICLGLIGIPLFLLESSLGQFVSKGPIGLWNIMPLLQGVGIACCIQSFIMAVYYNAPIAWATWYFVESFKGISGDLPWDVCWNITSKPCTNNHTIYIEAIKNNQTIHLASEVYFYDSVLGITSGLEDFGAMNWWLVLYNGIMWFLVFLVISLGAESLGKVAYFTSLFPYLMLTVMLITGFTQDGFDDGLYYYVRPNLTLLGSPDIWTAAVGQVFFSTGVAEGGLPTLSSYNSFTNNIVRDSLMIPVLDGVTSLFAGLCVFAILGFMAKSTGRKVEEVVAAGPGLIFVTYPQALSALPVPWLFSILFFFMVCILGLSSQFPPMETLCKVLEDQLSCLQDPQNKIKRICVRFSLCLLGFFLGMIFFTGSGYYLYELVDEKVVTYPLMVFALCESVVAAWIYGAHRLARDISIMIDWKSWGFVYWEFCWRFVAPAVIILLFILDFVSMEDFIGFEGYHYPSWTNGLIVGLILVSLIWIVIIALKVFYDQKFKCSYRLFQPGYSWGPKDHERRRLYHRLDPLAYSIMGIQCCGGDETSNLQSLDTTPEIFQISESKEDKNSNELQMEAHFNAAHFGPTSPQSRDFEEYDF